MRALSISVLALAAGCLQSGGGETPCARDADCAGQCARGGVCIADGTGRELRIRWTVDGVAPSPAAPEPCADLDGLEISFRGGGDDLSYYPVSCEIGSIYYDVLPPWLDEVVVSAIDPAGFVRAQVTRDLPASGEISVDLRP